MTRKNVLRNMKDDIDKILGYLGLYASYDVDKRYHDIDIVKNYHTWAGPYDGDIYYTEVEVVLDHKKNQYSCWATLYDKDDEEVSSDGDSGDTLMGFLNGVLNLIDGNWSALENLMDNEDTVREIIENMMNKINGGN